MKLAAMMQLRQRTQQDPKRNGILTPILSISGAIKGNIYPIKEQMKSAHVEGKGLKSWQFSKT